MAPGLHLHACTHKMHCAHVVVLEHHKACFKVFEMVHTDRTGCNRVVGRTFLDPLSHSLLQMCGCDVHQ